MSVPVPINLAGAGGVDIEMLGSISAGVDPEQFVEIRGRLLQQLIAELTAGRAALEQCGTMFGLPGQTL